MDQRVRSDAHDEISSIVSAIMRTIPMMRMIARTMPRSVVMI